MNATVRSNKTLTIVDVQGHIDLSTSPALRKTMLDSLKSGDGLAVNLAEVKYIDSSGIASLLEVLKEAKRKNKKFVLIGLTPAVREVLRSGQHLHGAFERDRAVVFGNAMRRRDDELSRHQRAAAELRLEIIRDVGGQQPDLKRPFSVRRLDAADDARRRSWDG